MIQTLNHRQSSAIQRKCAACQQEENLQQQVNDTSSAQAQLSPPPPSMGRHLQRQENQPDRPAVANWVEHRIQQSRGQGQALEDHTRNYMENRFGADFSQVNIHTGSTAVQLSQQLNANAFTVGNDVYFNSGKYQPQSSQGQKLLAHELTHTLQQGKTSSKVQRQDQDPKKPASSLSAQEIIKSHTDWAFDLDEEGLGAFLLHLLSQSESNIVLVLEVFGLLDTTNQNEVAYGFIEKFSDSQVEHLKKTDQGVQFLLKLREYLATNVTTEGRKKRDHLFQLIDQIDFKNLPIKTVTVKVVRYAGFKYPSDHYNDLTNTLMESDCNIQVKFETPVDVSAADTQLDLPKKFIHLNGKGSSEESNKALARAGTSEGTIVAVLAHDIKVDGKTGYAGYTPKGAGIFALSSVVSKQPHSFAHEIGHYLGLEHLDNRFNLMHEDANNSNNAFHIKPWQCSTMRNNL